MPAPAVEIETIDPLETERRGIESEDSPSRVGYPLESNRGNASLGPFALPELGYPRPGVSLVGDSPDNSIHRPFPLLGVSPLALFFDLPLRRCAAGDGYRAWSLWNAEGVEDSGLRGELRDRSFVGDTTDKLAGDRPDAEMTPALSTSLV